MNRCPEYARNCFMAYIAQIIKIIVLQTIAFYHNNDNNNVKTVSSILVITLW